MLRKGRRGGPRANRAHHWLAFNQLMPVLDLDRVPFGQEQLDRLGDSVEPFWLARIAVGAGLEDDSIATG